MTVFSSIGAAPVVSIRRNRPLRSRSARTVPAMTRAPALSPAKSAMATGMRLAPAPVISMESWAWENPAVNREKTRKIRRESLIIGFVFNKFRAILLFKRFVFDFEDALEQ